MKRFIARAVLQISGVLVGITTAKIYQLDAGLGIASFLLLWTCMFSMMVIVMEHYRSRQR